MHGKIKPRQGLTIIVIIELGVTLYHAPGAEDTEAREYFDLYICFTPQVLEALFVYLVCLIYPPVFTIENMLLSE